VFDTHYLSKDPTLVGTTRSKVYIQNTINLEKTLCTMILTWTYLTYTLASLVHLHPWRCPGTGITLSICVEQNFTSKIEIIVSCKGIVIMISAIHFNNQMCGRKCLGSYTWLGMHA
jgi:hypothetical protein